MISIYLFTQKTQFIFSISFVFKFQKNYLHLLYENNLLQNFNLGTKIIFTYLLKRNEFLQFYFKKIFRFIFI